MMIMGYLRTVFFKLKFQKFGSKSLSVQVFLAGVLRNVNKKQFTSWYFWPIRVHLFTPVTAGAMFFWVNWWGQNPRMADWKIPECRLLTRFFFFGGVQCLNFWSAMAMLSNSKQCNSVGLNNSALIWQATATSCHTLLFLDYKWKPPVSYMS